MSISNAKKKELFEQLKQFSKENGFELLSPKWLGAVAKHQFRHIESGEQYEWVPHQIKRGFPMVDGQRYLTQEVCRQAFTHIFGGEFKTNRERLKTKNSGKSMELDGYEEFSAIPNPLNRVSSYTDKDGAEVAFNLPIAFEFQGHDSHREHGETIDRDELKAKFCKEEGIFLVQINPPGKEKEYRAFWNSVRDSDFIYAHICNSIQSALGVQNKIEFPPDFKIDISNWNPDKKRHAELKQFSIENGFELLSPKWLGSAEKHKFRHIESGKEYEGAPGQIFRKGFPKDLRTDDDRYIKLKQFSKENGFELLTPEWLGAVAKHQFRHIESGQKYWGTPDKVLGERGFPKDFNRYDNDHQYKRLKQLAKENGFELLTPMWMGAVKKHQFRRIESGKEYEWTPNIILNVSGFPKDLRTDDDRYIELKQFSEEGGFELQTPKWMGGDVRHHFRHIESGKVYEWNPRNILSRGFPKDLRTDDDRYIKLKQFSMENGFELLSPKWMGDVKHRFRHIESGKEYWCDPYQLKRQGFPKELRTNEDRYNELKQISEENCFELLSPKWLGSAEKHKFRHIESGKVYEWNTKNILSRGFPKDLRTDDDRYIELKQFSKENGFELLSPKWMGTEFKHRFRHIESGQEYDGRPDQILRKGFPKRFLKQDAPQPAQVSPNLVTKRIAKLNALTQPFRDDLNMVAGRTEDMSKVKPPAPASTDANAANGNAAAARPALPLLDRPTQSITLWFAPDLTQIRDQLIEFKRSIAAGAIGEGPAATVFRESVPAER